MAKTGTAVGTVAGGVAGSYFGPAGAMAGASIGGTLGGLFDSDDEANAAQAIAEQQLQVAREGLQFEKDSRNKALEFAYPSYEEMANRGKMIEARGQYFSRAMASLEKEQALLDAVDPALKEAGNQAFKLLQGENAKALAPIERQRARQKTMLENNLAANLGGGFRTSSAGIEALQRFDDETMALMTNTQMSTLNSFLGLTASIRPDMTGKTSQVYSTLGNMDASIASQYQNESARKIGAVTGTPVNFNNVVQNAGAGSIGDLYSANRQNKLTDNILGSLGNFGMQGMQMEYMKDIYAGQNGKETNLGSLYSHNPGDFSLGPSQTFSNGLNRPSPYSEPGVPNYQQFPKLKSAGM